jgi:prolyl oligopeptidase
MTRLVFEAIFYLGWTDWLMRRHGIRQLHEALKAVSRSPECHSSHIPGQICRAVDIACVLYFKQVLCLQRSVTTTILLRHYGYSAELVIGARIVPLKSHAWVEINHVVINDKSYMPSIYRELERC